MPPFPLKGIINDSEKGALIGVGISLAVTMASGGINPVGWLLGIGFGMMMGFILTFCNATLVYLVDLVFTKNKSVFLYLVTGFTSSALVFYGIVSLLKVAIDGRYLFASSMGTGMLGAMLTLFFIYDHEKDERLVLEKRQRELAVLEERNRIARELHDSVSQTLFGINLNLNTIQYVLDRDPQKARELSVQTQEMVEEVQTEMRLMIHELRPLALRRQGFFEATEGLVSLFKRRYNLEFCYEFTGNETNIDNETQLVLYRVLQESMHNIVRHSGGTMVEICLQAYLEKIILVIEDNGKGFDLEKIGPDSVGIAGMRERVERVGGELQIHSTLGKGTAIIVKIEKNHKM